MVNVFRACVGLAPESHMALEHRVPSMMRGALAKEKVVGVKRVSPVSTVQNVDENDAANKRTKTH